MIHTIYLAGGVEAAEDNGVTWRKQFREGLDGYQNLKITDPTTFTTADTAHRRLSRASTAPATSHMIVRELIMSPCIRAVHRSNMLVCNYDDTMRHGAGSFCEVWEAHWHMGIPVYLITAPINFVNEIVNVPLWLSACARYTFDSISACQKYIIDTYTESRT